MSYMAKTMKLISTDTDHSSHASELLARMLEGFDCPAILVTASYEIVAANNRYQTTYGEIEADSKQHCYQVSHGYQVPCDQAGETCPLAAASRSRQRERVLHIHQTPRGKEHVDVEMLPIYDANGVLVFFVELLRPLPLANGYLGTHEMIGISPAFTALLEKIARVAAFDASVLLLGQSGTGKELAAKAIHLGSQRAAKPMVTLECAGLTDALFENELFGHVKGAFTGAQTNKTGLVELADGGTLFLDEIGDVPLSMQVKLLRLLETGTFRPVGSELAKTADFRLICATHKNIAAMIRDGTFRQDLYYRINVFPIRLPSLVERATDIPLIAQSLLQRISPEKEYHLTQSALTVIEAKPLHGNIRELRNLLTRAVVLAKTNLIDHAVITLCFEADQQELATVASPVLDAEWVDLRTAETRYLNTLMQTFDDDRQQVARIAGISVRSLYRKLESQ
jgi:transcriptional regulator with PAS, ATPase and Fis domain